MRCDERSFLRRTFAGDVKIFRAPVEAGRPEALNTRSSICMSYPGACPLQIGVPLGLHVQEQAIDLHRSQSHDP